AQPILASRFMTPNAAAAPGFPAQSLPLSQPFGADSRGERPSSCLSSIAGRSRVLTDPQPARLLTVTASAVSILMRSPPRRLPGFVGRSEGEGRGATRRGAYPATRSPQGGSNDSVTRQFEGCTGSCRPAAHRRVVDNDRFR